MLNGVFGFIGTSPAPQAALDEATAKATDWLARHNWRDAEGRSCYTQHVAIDYRDGLWVIIVTLTGPVEELR